MKKVKIAVLASMVGLLALFGVSAQSAVQGSSKQVPAAGSPATTVTAPATTPAPAPVAQTDQSGNHEFEGEEADGAEQSDNEMAAAEENGTEKSEAEESAAIEQGGTKSAVGTQAASEDNSSAVDTDNIEVQE